MPIRWLMVLLLLGGCQSTLVLDIRGSACVNPQHWPTTDPAGDSQVLGLRIFQLKKPVALENVDVTQFAFQDQVPKFLDENLATAPPGTRASENIDTVRLQSRVYPLRLLKDTSHLLLITVSHHPGEYSKRLIPVPSDKTVALCVDQYHVLLDPKTWPCSKPTPSEEP